MRFARCGGGPAAPALNGLFPAEDGVGIIFFKGYGEFAANGGVREGINAGCVACDEFRVGGLDIGQGVCQAVE